MAGSRRRHAPDALRARARPGSDTGRAGQEHPAAAGRGERAARQGSTRSGHRRLRADSRPEPEAHGRQPRHRRRLSQEGRARERPHRATRAVRSRDRVVHGRAERRCGERARQGRARIDAHGSRTPLDKRCQHTRRPGPSADGRPRSSSRSSLSPSPASAAVGWWYARESPAHQGPIVADLDRRACRRPSSPAYGAERTDTPAIDALATESVVFERAYTHSPQTLPAHASILSGQLPPRARRPRRGRLRAAGRSARTLAELLRNRGFTTGAAVSSFLLRPQSGRRQGFSFFDAEMPAPTAATKRPRSSARAR